MLVLFAAWKPISLLSNKMTKTEKHVHEHIHKYEHSKTNVMAILSLIFAFLFFPLGFIFGIIALVQIKKSNESGQGLAISGIVLSSLIFIGYLVIVSILGALAGTVASTFDTDSETTSEVKESSIKLNVIDRKIFKQVGQTFEGSLLLGKRSSGNFLVIDIEVENIGKEPLWISSNDIKLYDKEGRKYIPDTEAMIYRQDSFLFETINPGVKQSGVVIFDVQDPNKEYELKVYNSVFSWFD